MIFLRFGITCVKTNRVQSPYKVQLYKEVNKDDPLGIPIHRLNLFFERGYQLSFISLVILSFSFLVYFKVIYSY